MKNESSGAASSEAHSVTHLFWVAFALIVVVAILDFGLAGLMVARGTFPQGIFPKVSVAARVLLIASSPFVRRKTAFALLVAYVVLFLDFLNRSVNT